MSLLALSLVRPGHVPSVPTNDQRMRAYRAATPAVFGNTTLAERIAGAAYARAAIADAAPTTETYTKDEP